MITGESQIQHFCILVKPISSTKHRKLKSHGINRDRRFDSPEIALAKKHARLFVIHEIIHG